MAAVARSPHPPDPMNARVPCPFCGGFVHPVAGRCKHCKQDLSTSRVRPRPGPIALPALASPLVGHPPASPVAFPVVLPVAAYAVDTGMMPRRSWARNWPLLVIVLAIATMVVALVLLVLPPHRGGNRRGITPPSNDPMDTDALPGAQPNPCDNRPDSRAR
jgi:hypothetical protein